MKKDGRVYLDNATTTRVDDRVIKAMLPFLEEKFAVPSSIFSHRDGLIAKEAVERVRELILKKLKAKEGKVIFTSGGTEGNNIILKGLFKKPKKRHIITTGIEHLSVLNVVKQLEREGFKVTYVPVDSFGFVDLKALRSLITPETALVSIQYANQEVGTIQNLKEIGKIVKERGSLFHTDACLGFPYLNIDVEEMGIDFLTMSAHKFYGPKGVGAIYVRDLSLLSPILHGGYNEFNLRPGTENVPGIVGLGKAVEIFDVNEIEKVKNLKEYLLKRIESEIEDIRVNTPQKNSHPGILNITFYFIEGESIVLRMDMEGISVITGSACFSKSLEASHVLLSMGLTHEIAHGSIRFSLSKYNTKEEIDYTVDVLKRTVKILRELSPLKKEE